MKNSRTLKLASGISLTVALTTFLSVSTAVADELLIERVERTQMDATMPGRGLSMDQVESRFGTPAQRHGAVGDPPITRWVYDGYTVYFEGRWVIDSVANLGDEESLGSG